MVSEPRIVPVIPSHKAMGHPVPPLWTTTATMDNSTVDTYVSLEVH